MIYSQIWLNLPRDDGQFCLLHLPLYRRYPLWLQNKNVEGEINFKNNLKKKTHPPLTTHTPFFDLSRSDLEFKSTEGKENYKCAVVLNPSLPLFQRGSKDRHDKKKSIKSFEQ